MPYNVHQHCSRAKEVSAEGWPALHMHWHGQNTCHKHPHKKKKNPFGKISDLAALACQQPKKCRQDIALVPILAGTSVGIYLTSPSWFPLHGHKLSHPVNTQLDMKTSTHFVYIFTLPFTASASTMVIQTLWLGIPFWQVPTLILNKAGLAWNQPTEGGFSFVSGL